MHVCVMCVMCGICVCVVCDLRVCECVEDMCVYLCARVCV